MTSRLWLMVLALALALSQMSCAVGNTLVPLDQSMPAAKAALKPEYRVFYDSLQDYGDWVLIEPYGYVFRPRVSLDTWRPYGNGFWVPTDLYGWVWVSTEPFGWATYHYGDWFFDPYQGWVWLPGLDWGPSWVAWQQTGSYVGWAPLMPAGANTSSIPGGAYTYVQTRDLGSTDLQKHIVPQSALAAQGSPAEPVENLVEHAGVTFNRGPQFEIVEREAGPLRRVKIDDLVQPTLATTPSSGGSSADRPASPTVKPRAIDTGDTWQHAAERAARDAQSVVDQKGAAPPRVMQVRPFGVPGRGPRAGGAAHLPDPRRSKLSQAPADTVATH